MKTPIAAKQLGVPVYKLASLIRFQKITPPEKDTSGDYIWAAADIERARAALAQGRSRKAVPA
jgi:hypothetical protein